MPHFLAVIGTLDEARAERLIGHLRAYGWAKTRHSVNATLWSRGALAVTDSPSGRGWILGEAFRAGAVWSKRQLPLDTGVTPLAEATALIRQGWGSYVALWPDREGPGGWALRDPSGELEVLFWRRAGLTCLASSLKAPGMAALAPDLSIRWDRVGRWLSDMGEIAAEPGLDGLEAVTAGELREFARSSGERRQLWTPAVFVRANDLGLHERRGAKRLSQGAAEELQALVARRIDLCVEAYGTFAPEGARLLAEVSGGLDSSVFASALRQTANADVAAWLNIFPPDAEGDERRYARAVATHLGFELTEIEKPNFTLDLEALEVESMSARPALNAMDQDYDRTVLKLAEDTNAWAIWTGQGGDEIFFASRTPLIAADILAGPRRWAVWDPRLRRLARWTRTSVWSLYRAGRGGGVRSAFSTAVPQAADAIRRASDPPSHPWRRDLAEVSPAKEEQITFLTRALLYRTEGARTDRLRLIHGPLLQPIVELCLEIPAAILTACERDRALVRAAFAQRLPASVLVRRGKGDLAAYYGRAVAGSLSTLRPYLLEGRLMEKGLLDRGRLEAALDEDDLCRTGASAELLELTAVEAWTRAWTDGGRTATVDPLR